MDEETYVEQGLMWKDAHWAYLHYIFETLGVPADLLLLGTPTTDEFSHQFMGLVTPTDIDGNPNPFYDDVTNDDVPDGRVDEREGFIRTATRRPTRRSPWGASSWARTTRPSSSPPTTASRRSGSR